MQVEGAGGEEERGDEGEEEEEEERVAAGECRECLFCRIILRRSFF